MGVYQSRTLPVRYRTPGKWISHLTGYKSKNKKMAQSSVIIIT